MTRLAGNPLIVEGLDASAGSEPLGCGGIGRVSWLAAPWLWRDCL
jgi:hypothetical protein